MFEFLKPINGDVLFETADGELRDGSLYAKIFVRFSGKKTILVNGVKATEKETGIYCAEIGLDAYRNTVEAKCVETGEMIKMILFWFRNGYKTYRLGIDDVIWCLENIYKHQEDYNSIFDDPYLGMYRELHEKYGCHVHMHIYYQTDDGTFNLSMFPDKYRNEFGENANWLRFTFHALANLPDNPYRNASYDQVVEEGRMVEKEILRFAGPEVMSEVTSQHWSSSKIYGTRAFRALGFKVLEGYFWFDKNGEPMVSYYLNKEQTAHAHDRDFWVDTDEDIIFVKSDIVLNEFSPDEIREKLDKISQNENHCFMYLLIHEQYFYQHYDEYEPDYRERLVAGIEWCLKNGYRSSWISDFAIEKKPGKA